MGEPTEINAIRKTVSRIVPIKTKEAEAKITSPNFTQSPSPR
jgi:hypothetical protein